MFGCGTLSIESAADDSGAVYFDDIPHVEDVYLTLQHAAGGPG
jgi:hypothetical protein